MPAVFPSEQMVRPGSKQLAQQASLENQVLAKVLPPERLLKGLVRQRSPVL
jgi:hypothetical protein